MPIAIIALFLGTFSIGTAEFVIAGLLPDVSENLGISIPTAGFLITGYAIGVAVGAPLLAIALNALSRKAALLSLMAIFVAGQALCALAPTYEWLLAARIIVSCAHGAFFGVAAVAATYLAAPGKSGQAVSLLLAGLTVANIFGVPAGTALGNYLGWRATFWAVGAMGIVALVAMVALLPANLGNRQVAAGVGRQVTAVLRGTVLMTFAIAILVMIGQFSVFTYIAPLLTETSGIDPHIVPLILLLFGIGSTIGVVVGGRLSDWNLMPSLIGILAAQIAAYALLILAMPHAWAVGVAVMIWGAASFAATAPAQARILKLTSDASNLASALIPTAFNIGIASGAVIGSLVLNHGFGYQWLPVLGATASALAFGVAMLSWFADRVVARSLRPA